MIVVVQPCRIPAFVAGLAHLTSARCAEHGTSLYDCWLAELLKRAALYTAGGQPLSGEWS